MKNKRNIIIAVVILALFGGGMYFLANNFMSRALQAELKTGEQISVKNVVTEFGKKIQLVDLTAPSSTIIQSIKENYGPFISQGLLDGWTMNPERAPGKTTASSLSSDLTVIGIDRDDDGAYEVQAQIIETYSPENGTTPPSLRYEVTFKLRNQDGRWVITGATKVLQA